MSESKMRLYEMCIDFIFDYYIESLHWSEDEAYGFALGTGPSRI